MYLEPTPQNRRSLALQPVSALASCSRRNATRLAAAALRAMVLTATVGTLAVGPSTWAQTAGTGIVRGHVQSQATGNFLNNARVRVVGSKLEAFTDVAGEFQLVGVPAGAVTLD